MDTALPVVLEVWRSKEFQNVFHIFVWLCSINAGFWILARAMGAFVDVFSELFWEDLWQLLATLYNTALAVFFSAVMFASATRGALGKDLLWREMCGFVLLYMALGAAYMDRRTHRLHDSTGPGYALGLIGYLMFAAFPHLVAYPEMDTLITMLKTLSDSWIGKSLTVFMVVGIVLSVIRSGLREMFYHLSPFLWFVGALKHPPIRVRRSKAE